MTKDIISLINEKLREMEKNLVFLKQASYKVSKDNIKDDIIRYWGIERGLQILIESVIDIANIIISSNDIEKPLTYRETILEMSRIGIVPKVFAEELSKMAGFRNILVHDYAEVDEGIILEVLDKKLDDFIEYINYINKWLKENYS
ncbi:type VII toxin-antitoxin system HepT family RNase toxin [Clostridium sp. Cult1]|uniref:type VII toxin-antitoxin system HepT family RNase toxin n=1 Tax=Clostridium sp. Cult1 TaxID=2079002 RepID=UPI001F256947|nr:DUF86 domain-containing protein [Clostridium sp. Cult1]MCF6463977.1 DUF86 domain-containing protein [Clostridium sp. Cult1]